ncbi:MAG: glycosyltransferase [Bacteroidetes bacterium]|nr:glycosyltransferase [Bacteroidota bacterium]
MNVFLFANFFPYKRAEPFLVNEFDVAISKVQSVSVFTLYGKPSEANLITGEQTKLFTPVFENANHKKQILSKGLFNLAPFHFHAKEFFVKGILFQPKKLYWFFISLFITRASLSSPSYKNLVAQLKNAESPLLYFYWGDNLAWLIPYLKQQVPKVKIVLRLHGSDLYEHLKADYAPLRNVIFKEANAIFTVSEFGQKYLQNKYPKHSEKIHLARLGVFDQGLNPTSDAAFTIVSVSNVIPLKRVALIFEALQLLKVDITWHHFGDGPLLQKLRDLSTEARPGLTVSFHGYVSNQEIINFYATVPVHLFINVSTTEGVPVSIMEALSFGIPVIATNAGGTSELVNTTLGKLLKVELTALELAEEINAFTLLSKEEQLIKRKNARLQFEDKASAHKNYNLFYDQLWALFR